MKIIEEINHNCKVFKLGYAWPLCIYSRFEFADVVKQLTPTFGEPAREYHYARTWSSNEPPRIKLNYDKDSIDTRRWYAGQRQWRYSEQPKRDFWIVFRNERDRTLALMLLGK